MRAGLLFPFLLIIDGWATGCVRNGISLITSLCRYCQASYPGWIAVILKAEWLPCSVSSSLNSPVLTDQSWKRQLPASRTWYLTPREHVDAAGKANVIPGTIRLCRLLLISVSILTMSSVLSDNVKPPILDAWQYFTLHMTGCFTPMHSVSDYKWAPFLKYCAYIMALENSNQLSKGFINLIHV